MREKWQNLSFTEYNANDMPSKTMVAVAEICGVKNTIYLIDKFGGRALSIPIKRKTDIYHELKETFPEFADDILYNFSGEVINIPVRSTVLQYIVGQIDLNKETISELIYRYSVNRTMIYKIAKENRVTKSKKVQICDMQRRGSIEGMHPKYGNTQKTEFKADANKNHKKDLNLY